MEPSNYSQMPEDRFFQNLINRDLINVNGLLVESKFSKSSVSEHHETTKVVFPNICIESGFILLTVGLLKRYCDNFKEKFQDVYFKSDIIPNLDEYSLPSYGPEKFIDIDIKLGDKDGWGSERNEKAPPNFTLLFENTKGSDGNTEIKKLKGELNTLLKMLREGYKIKNFIFNSIILDWIEDLKKGPDSQIEYRSFDEEDYQIAYVIWSKYAPLSEAQISIIQTVKELIKLIVEGHK